MNLAKKIIFVVKNQLQIGYWLELWHVLDYDDLLNALKLFRYFLKFFMYSIHAICMYRILRKFKSIFGNLACVIIQATTLQSFFKTYFLLKSLKREHFRAELCSFFLHYGLSVKWFSIFPNYFFQFFYLWKFMFFLKMRFVKKQNDWIPSFFEIV